jgi:aryl-alcohol dehydrogenase-like predicted oxidoreductase
MGMLPWSPLGGGWLTGKYSRDKQPETNTRLAEVKSGMEAYERRVSLERTWNVIDVLRTIAEARGISMAQIALAWVVDRPAVTSVILGARTMEQLDDNLAAADLHLDDKERALLDEASDPHPADYPYGEPGMGQRSRKITGGR